MANKSDSNIGIWVATVLMLIVLAVGGYFAWRTYQEREAPPPPKQEVAPVEAPDAGQAMNLADGDALLKAAAADLSPEEALARWLAEPDLVRRLVGATFQVSRGESPRELLQFLRPEAEFTVDEVEDKTQLAPKPKVKPKVKKGKLKRKPSKHVVHSFMNAASTARYDLVTKVLASIDTAKLGALYAKLSPYAEAAFREAAPPGKTLEGVYSAAVDHLAAVPITDERIEVVPMEEGVGYAFKDPGLEAMTPAQKHLLRMGSTNARTVVKQLQAFRTAVFAARDAGH